MVNIMLTTFLMFETGNCDLKTDVIVFSKVQAPHLKTIITLLQLLLSKQSGPRFRRRWRSLGSRATVERARESP
jgi:hypothetical protein